MGPLKNKFSKTICYFQPISLKDTNPQYVTCFSMLPMFLLIVALPPLPFGLCKDAYHIEVAPKQCISVSLKIHCNYSVKDFLGGRQINILCSSNDFSYSRPKHIVDGNKKKNRRKEPSESHALTHICKHMAF